VCVCVCVGGGYSFIIPEGPIADKLVELEEVYGLTNDKRETVEVTQ